MTDQEESQGLARTEMKQCRTMQPCVVLSTFHVRSRNKVKLSNPLYVYLSRDV